MPFDFPTGDEPFPPGGYGPPGQPPQPPSGGGGGGGNPFNVTLRGTTPAYPRRLMGRPGGYGAAPATMQFRGQPNLNTYSASPYSASGGAASSIFGPRQSPYDAPPGQGQVSPSGTPREWSPYLDPKGGFSQKALVDYLTAIGYRAGAFDPEGSPAFAKALQKWLDLAGAGDMRKAQLGAQLYAYDDPTTAQYIRANAEQSVRDRNALALSQGVAGNIQKNQDFLQQLLAMYFGRSLQRDPKGADYAGAAAGEIGGALAGALIP